MHRSQLMLSEEQYRFLADEASRTDKSMSALIRGWLDEQIQRRSNSPVRNDAIWEVVGIGRSGDRRASERHDQVLAAERLKRMRKVF